MAEDERDLVTIASCGDSTEASLIRGFLESEGVYCYIQGEEHRQLLGVLGSYVVPQVMVKREDAEQATELVDVFRNSVSDEDLEQQAGIDEELEFDDAAVEEDGPYRSPARLKSDQRPRKPLVSLGVGLVAGLGFGHRSAGATRRSVVLAVLEISIIVVTLWGTLAPHLGAGIVALMHICDGVGGAVVAHDHNRAEAAAGAPPGRN